MFELIMRRPAPIEIPGGVRRKSGVDGGTKQVNTHTGKGKGQTGRPLAQAPRLRGPAPVPQVAKPGERETASPEVEWLFPTGVYLPSTNLANFTMSVLNNHKELGGQQLCPMGLVGHPIDCRTLIVVMHTLLAVVPALKLDLLALRVHVG